MNLERLKFLSICSGIEAASVAFQPLGWEAVAFAEIEPFPCRVLAHHYPQVPNLGDLTRFREWDAGLLAQADVLCGGTPCQAFSVAGLRGSLDDERGNLTLTFCHLYDHLDDLRTAAGRPPAVCLWENVPGIFSDKQNAFGCFLAALAGESLPLQPPGGKWTDAGAVLGPRRAVARVVKDAQYFGLSQRRKRVFVVASADPDFDPAAVLLEFDGVRRDSPPRREAGEGTAPTLAARTQGGGGLGTDAECDGAVIAEPRGRPNVPEVANCLTRRMDKGLNTTLDEGQTPIVEVVGALPTHHTPNGHGCAGVNNQAVNAGHIIPERRAFAFQPRIARNGRGDMGDKVNALQAQSGQTGKGDAAPCVAYTVHGTREGTQEVATPTDTAGTIHEGTGSAVQNSSNTLVAAVHENQRGELTLNDTCGTLNKGGGKPGQGYPAVLDTWAVRRLTPEECELLQGFPIGYTLLPDYGKRKGEDLAESVAALIALGFSPEEAARLAPTPDGPRYKALGNSWAVPCVRWIARRIHAALNPESEGLSHA